jgi:hypothetical protein
MQPRAKNFVLDVLEACADIDRLTGELSLADYVTQKDARRLVERYLEII